MTLTNDENLSSVLSAPPNSGRSLVAAYVCHMHNGTHKSFCKDLFTKTPIPLPLPRGRRLCFWKIVYFIWVAPNEKWPWNITVLIMLGLRCNQRRKKCQSNKSLAKQGRSQDGGLCVDLWVLFSAALTAQKKKNTHIYREKVNEEYIFRLYQPRRNVNINSFNILCVFLWECVCVFGIEEGIFRRGGVTPWWKGGRSQKRKRSWNWQERWRWRSGRKTGENGSGWGCHTVCALGVTSGMPPHPDF